MNTLLEKLNRRVSHYTKIHSCKWSFALVVSVYRHQMAVVQTLDGEGRYDDLLRSIVADSPRTKWLMEKDVFSSTHATVEDFILAVYPADRQASYREANDRWLRAKLLFLGKRPQAPGSEKNWGRSFGE